ncbi:MAG: aspartate-semialdehyde dehydrogenase, partial [Bacteroidetes bacterium RIFOXYA2_FULL_33_7]
MRVAIVGVTGLVGKMFLKVLAERNFPITELIPVASEKSLGKIIEYKNTKYKIVSISEAVSMKPDIALFSAGGSVSLEWAEAFAKNNTVVIDNSSAWRMDKTKKLVIPEINGNVLTIADKIIANPNCSTIQMLIAIAPLHREYKVKRIVVSTYQSITGTGMKAVNQMENERKGIDGLKAYPHTIDKNCLPHCDTFDETGYTKEEMKLVNETKKILDANINVTATAVRVPVVGGHSEAVNIEFENEPDIIEIRKILSHAKGVVVQDDVFNNFYPMPLTANDKDEVF